VHSECACPHVSTGRNAQHSGTRTGHGVKDGLLSVDHLDGLDLQTVSDAFPVRYH
jgi:hypothetical protein